jgi:RNA polymerase sigma factor (sigma-70 family)
MDLTRLSDEELLAATPRRPEAFGEFYARHESAVLGFMLRRTGEPELAADLAAEAFAAALVSVRRFKPGPAPAAAWLYGIARHVLLSSLRRSQVEDKARRKLDMAPIALTDELLDRIERHAAMRCSESVIRQRVSRGLAVLRQVNEESR